MKGDDLMNQRTQELTYGAMLSAVFGLLLLVNRQTGGFFEEMVFYVLPIPMAVFTLRFGWKKSVPVFVCMGLLAFFLGTPYTLFYALCDALIGIVLGTCLKERVSGSRTQLLIMVLCAAASVLSSVTLASLFGIDMRGEILEMQGMVSGLFAKTGVDSSAAGSLLSYDSLKRLFILSMAAAGVLQGFVMYRLSLLIMRRLRLPVPPPDPVGLFYPPKWTGYAGLVLMFVYMRTTMQPLSHELLQELAQTAGLCACIYLLAFGYIALILASRRLMPRLRIAGVLISILILIAASWAGALLGFASISAGLHDLLLQPAGSSRLR